MDLIWNEIDHPNILPGYVISQYGDIKQSILPDEQSYKASYHSSNGYDYAIFINKDGKPQLFPIDDLLALTFIPIPKSLQSKRVKVNHINGNTRDNDLGNLEWVEDIEEWKTCTYPGVKPDMYEVSSWGNIRNKSTKSEIYGTTDKDGYQICDLKKEYQIWKHFKRHRLIAWEFCIRDIDFQTNQVNHIDGIKYHNWYKNLEIVTGCENQKHAWNNGLKDNVLGENNDRADMKNEEIEIICGLIVEYEGDIDEILKCLEKSDIHVSKKVIRHILYKESWKHISDKYFKKDQFKKLTYLTEQDVIKIIGSLIKHKNSENILNDVVEELKDTIPSINVSKVGRILRKEKWKKISDNYFKKGEL